MSNRIVFFVEGEPRAKQSFRSLGRHGGYTPAHIKAWQKTCAGWAQIAMMRLGDCEPLQGNLSVKLTFFLGNKRRIDLDNLSKAVQDGLNNIAWLDDQQNVHLEVDKFVCRERSGVLVEVEPNTRKVEISEEEMSHIIQMTEYGLDTELLQVMA